MHMSLGAHGGGPSTLGTQVRIRYTELGLLGGSLGSRGGGPARALQTSSKVSARTFTIERHEKEYY